LFLSAISLSSVLTKNRLEELIIIQRILIVSSIRLISESLAFYYELIESDSTIKFFLVFKTSSISIASKMALAKKGSRGSLTKNSPIGVIL